MTRAAGFQIRRQQSATHGCIPACAISVLAEHSVDPGDEASLVSAMWGPGWRGRGDASGFSRLCRVLSDRGVECTTRIRTGDLESLLREEASRRPLVAVRNDEGKAHCLVVTGYNEQTQTVTLADPGNASIASMKLDALREKWCGDAAILELETCA